jgi:rhodanese-related sulfurtransferase
MSFSQQANAQFGGLFKSAPEVKEITTKDLIKLQKSQQEAEENATKQGHPKPAADFILVDVRSVAESQVSIIPGAITKAEFEKNLAQYQGRTVIPYCTVGGRSGRYAQDLAKQGVTVMNYKGSILEWCKEKQPLVTSEGKTTNRVHIYSSNYKVPAEYSPTW